jgi:protein-tyrosine phosphatase
MVDVQLSRRHVIKAAAVAGAGLLLAPASCRAAATVDGGGGAQAAAAPPRRFLELDGAFNVRDVGGYPAGRSTVLTGRVYRSGSLHRLTEQGHRHLAALSLGHVVDFRAGRERSGREYRLPDGVTAVHAPVGSSAPMAVGPPTGGLSEPDPATEAEFRGYVTTTASRESYGAALRALAVAPGKPLLWHCNSGTYRTGWASAVLLTLLGVSRTQVSEDFLLSNDAFGATFAFAEYLDAAFDAVDATFGSFDRYLDRGLRVGPDTVAALRRSLLT